MKLYKKVLVLALALAMVFVMAACGSSDDTQSSNQEILVDARSEDVYSGWAVDGETNGGHLAGAVNISADWINMGDSYEVNAAENKTLDDYILDIAEASGLTTDSEITVYDTNDEDAQVVADYLTDKGYENVTTMNASEEINADGAELETYENYQMNVPAEVVQNISDWKLNGAELSDNAKEIVGDTDDDHVRIFHAEYASSGKYTDDGYQKDADIDWEDGTYYATTGHVPGAEPISTDDFEPEEEVTDRDIIKQDNVYYGFNFETGENNTDCSWIATYLVPDDDELIKLANKYGFSTEDTVIVAGPQPMATTKIALIMKYLGIDNVYVMNGAYNTWQSNGYEMATDINLSTPGTFELTEPGNPDLIDTIDEVQDMLADTDNYVVVDTRTEEEYNGLDSGYSYHDIAGRIDGTVNSPSGIGYSSSMYFYRNPDNTMRSKAVLDAMWAEQGVDTSKHMSFFCGSGWRAAEETWDALVLGYDASLYNAGWQGWSDAGLPFIDQNGDNVKVDIANSEIVAAE